MITVNELKKKSLTRYTDFLIWYFCNNKDNIFPLVIPCNKGKPNDDLSQRANELREIHQYSKNNGKQAYSYDTDTVSTRSGKQTVITRIFFETEDDYISFINKKKDFELLKKVCIILEENLHTSFSEIDIRKWIVQNHEKIISAKIEDCIDSYWKNITICANWFYQNPESNLYLRTIPLPVHSKFIENNQSLIHSLCSKEKITKEKTFIKQHGLVDKPNFIRFRFLEKMKISDGFVPNEMQLPFEDFKELSSAKFLENIKNVFIVENEMVYITFPVFKNSICIWGHGFSVSQFDIFNWLKNYQIFYFGDLDEHGYEILSLFRNCFPNTKSFCMDMNTLNEFDCFRVKGESLKGVVPENLTKDELQVFMNLTNDKNRNRLEQERISHQWIKDCLLKNYSLIT
jgi:hypothetical protein